MLFAYLQEFFEKKFISQLLAWEGFAVRQTAEDGAREEADAGVYRHPPWLSDGFTARLEATLVDRP